jgi:hypothetical protein
VSEGKLQLHPYEPKETRFVLATLCSTIARAESWADVVTGCEALANSLRIAKKIEEEAFLGDFSAAALEQLKESGRELRGLQNGGSNACAGESSQLD